MARKTAINYWPTRKGGGYFCVFKAKRYELALGPDDSPDGPTYLKAMARFQEIMQGAEPKGNSVRVVLETYLQHIRGKRKAGTVEIRLRSFLPFVAFKGYGEKPVESLTHFDVYRFLEAMENPRKMIRKKAQPRRKPIKWGSGSKRNCVVGLLAAFNWAKRSGLVQKNPLDGIEKDSPTSRGAESLIGNDAAEVVKNHQRILAAVPPFYRPLIQALKDTGARPGELIAATAKDFKADMGAFVFHKESTRKGDQFSHKTSKKKDRVIFLVGETLQTVKALIETYPSGPLFRRKSGNPFHRVNVNDRFFKLQKKLMMKTLTAYSYRHQFATDMLKAGCDVDSLAEMMGNSAMVIRQHYSHLLADALALRSKLERFRMVEEKQSPLSVA